MPRKKFPKMKIYIYNFYFGEVAHPLSSHFSWKYFLALKSFSIHIYIYMCVFMYIYVCMYIYRRPQYVS